MTAGQGDRGRETAAVIAAVATTAVLVQLGLDTARLGHFGAALLGLSGYFTIWSNTAVAAVSTAYAVHGPGGHTLARPQLLAAVAVYILVVGVIDNTLLIDRNPVTGLRRWVDRALHMVVPVAYPLWWWLAAPRGRRARRHLPVAMTVPLAYGLFSLWRGSVTGHYPCFFIGVGLPGWVRTLANIAGLGLLFAALMALAADRRHAATA